MTNTVGIVLAGGLSRRFGTPKAFAELDSRFFYELAMEALEVKCDEVIVVTRHELLNRFPDDVKVITDLVDYEGCGPLAGILSAMEFVEADRYVVLPCDMPYMNGEVVEKLAARHDKGVTAVIVDGRYHPLVSIWDGDVKSNLREALERGQLRVMSILSAGRVTWVDGSDLTDDVKTVFTNVNTPEVLEGS